MAQKIAIFLAFLFLSSPLLLSNDLHEEPRLMIQNRVLVKIHNSTISVLDVAKKMDVTLNRFPEYANSPVAKYEYFSKQWRETLSQMIDQELILADAAKMELKITDAEVRENLLEKFGPNIMLSLDALGLTYQEARDMVYSELAVQRMLWYKAQAKAMASVGSMDVMEAYKDFVRHNPAKETWEYEVLSVKADDEGVAQLIAEEAFCSSTQVPFPQLPSILQPKESLEYTATVSAPITIENKNLSSAHKAALLSLAKGGISAPVKQMSRTGNSTVYRIFHLIDHTVTPPPTFQSIQNKIYDALLQEAVDRESKIYLAKLRKKHNLDAEGLARNIPPGFQPFSLQ